MNIWMTSDHHFGHQNIIKYADRPYSSVEEMDEALISNWNEVVSDGDVVWVLGDFAMGKIADTLPLAKRLKGIKMLISGNHDRCWIGHGAKGAAWVNAYLDNGFESVFRGNRLDLTAYSTCDFVMSHFPYTGDSHDKDRYEEFRPIDNGEWLLHGHTHSKEAVNGRQIHVGVDAHNYYPVNLDELIAIKENGA